MSRVILLFSFIISVFLYFLSLYFYLIMCLYFVTLYDYVFLLSIVLVSLSMLVIIMLLCHVLFHFLLCVLLLLYFYYYNFSLLSKTIPRPLAQSPQFLKPSSQNLSRLAKGPNLNTSQQAWSPKQKPMLNPYWFWWYQNTHKMLTNQFA